MRGQERILREQFARLECAACGAYHHLDDMLVLAQRGSRWLVLLTCWQCQRRGIFVASFPQSSTPPESLDMLESPSTAYPIAPTISQHWLAPTSPHLSEDIPGMMNDYPPNSAEDTPPITARDVDGIRRFLDGFNGDFRALFGPSDGLARG